MAAWPAMIVAPLSALGVQSLLLALARPACEAGRGAWLHGPAAATVLLCAVLTAWAWHGVRAPGDGDAATRQRHRSFAAIGAGVGAIATIAAAAMWWPLWAIPACTG